MPLPPSADRARTRYAAALYRVALLREPNEGRAGRAVVAAFRSINWENLALDDQVEARLVANLPPLPRFQVRPDRPLVGLPAPFWKLSPPIRLALGLRLLRGMGTPQIAQALRLPLSETQALLITGGRALGGEHGPLPDECHRCWTVRLDDPAAERGHLLSCPVCHDALLAWERSERALADQLGRAVGGLALPLAVDEELRAALDPDAQAGAPPLWRRPVALQGALVVVVLLGLAILFWPRGSGKQPEGTTTARTPAALIAAARSDYTVVPPVAGFLHRHWVITLGQPLLNFEADEWVDPQEPARHRMQLVADRATAEWQVGDGQDHLQYMSNLVPYFCGSTPVGVNSHTNERNSWPLSPTEQAAMRAARWEHGAWAIGLHYLNLAASADTIRSLGLAGSGPDATLTITAEGRTISGTLLLRFDPVNHTLREVHELHRNNGQTEDRVPWRLVTSETLSQQAVLQNDLINGYPDDNRPPLVERSGPILDQGCPLPGAEQTQSLPRLLTMPNMGTLTGLPMLPTGVDHAVIMGPSDLAAPGGFNQQFEFSFNNLQIIYFGATKRLVFLPETPPLANDHLIRAGPWHVHFFPQAVPTVFMATIQRADVGDPQQLDGRNPGNYSRVLAEGWTRDELLAVLATAGPLRASDWVSAPDRFYEPAPIDPVTRGYLLKLFKAARSYPGQTHHQVILETTRQAPFFAELRDPYHTPQALWPPVRRVESWSQYGPDNQVVRALSITSDTAGHVLLAQWHDTQLWHIYDVRTNSVTSQSSGAPHPLADELQPLAGAFDRHWQTLSDGTLVADVLQQLPSAADTAALYDQGIQTLDDWNQDLGTRLGQERRMFNADGTFQREELLAVLSSITSPTRSTMLLRSSVIEHDEWLPQMADSSFVWSPPNGTKQRSQADIQAFYGQLDQRPGFEVNLADAATLMPFPIWGWFPAWSPPLPIPRLSDISLQPPLASSLSTITGSYGPVFMDTIGNAVNLGVAVNVRYLLDSRAITILQGPAPFLRQLLQQTAPAWTAAEARHLMLHGQDHEVWVMRGPSDDTSTTHRWIVFELDGTLFMMQADLQNAELETILAHLGDFRVVAPKR